MATIQRPVKTYGTRSYVSEVAAAPGNQDPILSNEVDADLDTMYAAWNGGVDTVNIKDGSVSRAKLSTTDVLPSLPPVPIATDANKTVVVNSAGNGLVLGTGGTFVGATPPATPQVGQLWWRGDPDGNLFIYYDDGNSKQFVPAVPSSVGPWSVSGTTITPTDATKSVRIPGPGTGSGVDQSALVLGSRTGKMHLEPIPGLEYHAVAANCYWNGTAWTQDGASLPSWFFGADLTNDNWFVQHMPAGGANVSLMTLTGVGQLRLQAAITGATDRFAIVTGNDSTKVHMGSLNGAVGWGGITLNSTWNGSSWTADDSTKAQWRVVMQCSGGNDYCAFERGAPTTLAQSTPLWCDASGNLTMLGPTAIKASGTTWANPSDIRLKKNVAKYERGLSEILQLEPISYTLKSNDVDTCGFDAEQVRAVFPECVSTTQMKLDPGDEEKTEVLMLDIHPILIALINAVKELANGRA